jgi:hypothetical protein
MLAAPVWANLDIRDIKAAYGPLGPERKSLEVTPGDTVFFRFAIDGVHTDDAGRADGELRVQLTDPAGKTLVDNKEAIGGLLALGGQSLPGTAQVSFGPDAPAGDYKLSVTIRDKVSQDTANFERKLTCLKPDFALVQLNFSRDQKGDIPAPAGGTVGEMLYIGCKAVGFERSKAKPHVVFTLTMLDSRGKPQMPKPVRVEFAPENAAQAAKVGLVDFKGALVLNRVGDFRLQIDASDETGKQKTEFVAPLRVSAP